MQALFILWLFSIQLNYVLQQELAFFVRSFGCAFFLQKGDNMKSCGIVRKTDKVGRLVIPKEVRKQFSIDKNSFLEIFTDGEMIVLKKAEENTHDNT